MKYNNAVNMKFGIKKNDGTVAFVADIIIPSWETDKVKRQFAVAWALKNKFDLTDTDLSDTDLIFMDFTHIILERVNFSGSNLVGSNFSDSSIKKCNFNNSNATNAKFTDTNIYRTLVSNAKFTNCDFSDSVVEKVKFDDCDLDFTKWDNCLINRMSIFKGSMLFSSFTGCKAEQLQIGDIGSCLGGDFTDSKFEHLRISRSYIGGSDFRRSTFEDSGLDMNHTGECKFDKCTDGLTINSPIIS